KEADFKKKLTAEGYQIKKFKVSGNCYEIYGKNKEGKKVEIYFDPVSGAAVKTDIED
ncbi:MAG: PepSY domain-containing protein, partial [Vogesella sp.]